MKHRPHFPSPHSPAGTALGAFGLLLFILGVRRLGSTSVVAEERPEIGPDTPAQQPLIPPMMETAHAA